VLRRLRSDQVATDRVRPCRVRRRLRDTGFQTVEILQKNSYFAAYAAIK
jgi:hypothetical protein